MISRRRFLRAAGAVTGLGLGTVLYTWRFEPHWVEFVERQLPVTNLPAGLEGAQLVQMSDLHIGPQVDDAYLIHVFERVKSLVPEIIVYTGDFTSYTNDIF